MVKDGLPIKRSWRMCLVLAWGLFIAPDAGLAQSLAASDTFMVIDRGTALLGPNGIEIARLSTTAHAVGGLSLLIPQRLVLEISARTRFSVVVFRHGASPI